MLKLRNFEKQYALLTLTSEGQRGDIYKTFWEQKLTRSAFSLSSLALTSLASDSLSFNIESYAYNKFVKRK